MRAIRADLAAEMQSLVRDAATPVRGGETVKGQMRRAWSALGRPDFWRVRSAWHGEAGRWTGDAIEDFRARGRQLAATRAERGSQERAGAPAKARQVAERWDMGEARRQFTQVHEVIALIERGDFQAEASVQMQALLQRLGELAGPKGKAKGTLMLTLNFEVDGRNVAIVGETKTKAPKDVRARTFYFVTAQGGLSQEPETGDLFTGPREVGNRSA